VSCVAVIPARRAERTLAATLESLRLGNADFVERVLVVTSDGDPTADVARAWHERDARVELVLAPHDRTAGRARCDGYAAARLSMSAACEETNVLFVDADCRLENGGARRLATAMNASGAAAVTPRIAREGGLVARARHILEFKEAASRRPAPAAWLPPSTVMLCRGAAFERAGGFPDLWPGEDLVFTQKLRDLGETVVRSADVVCATTHAEEPVLRREWLRDGAHVNSVGWTPTGREVDAETVRDALVVVESLASALSEGPGGSNDLRWPVRDGVVGPDHVHTEVGEVLAGSKPGRTSDDQITLYKSVGVAVQDAAAAGLVLRAARRQGVGREIEV